MSGSDCVISFDKDQKIPIDRLRYYWEERKQWRRDAGLSDEKPQPRPEQTKKRGITEMGDLTRNLKCTLKPSTNTQPTKA